MVRCIHSFLLLLLVSSAAFAANKPAWTRGAKEFVAFQKWASDTGESSSRSHFRLVFSPSDEIIVSFVQSSALGQPVTAKDAQAVFVLLFISPKDGTLIKRIEWPLDKKPDYWFRDETLIKPLPEGGYVVVINDHLLILDSDLNVRYDKVLENNAQKIKDYKIFAPFAGPFFILEHGHYKREIIDSRNFRVIENLDGQSFKIRDISGDTVIVLQDGEECQYLSLKQIDGGWNNIGYVNRDMYVRFAYDAPSGSITV